MQVFHSNYPNLLTLSDEFLSQHPTSIFSTLKSDTGITSFDLATLLPECNGKDVSTFLNHLENMQNSIEVGYKDYNEELLLLLDRTSIKPFTFFSYSDLAIRATIKDYEIGLCNYIMIQILVLKINMQSKTG